uniref:Phosphodiesterase n=1 Tax=Clastoptera arizonana TaxID=38151 RepID=A0A1B6CZB4_9HEMI
MCTPIITPNNEVKGVIDLIRQPGKEMYNLRHLYIALAATVWIGNLIFYSDLDQFNTKLLSTNKDLFNTINGFSLSFETFDTTLADVMIFGEITLEAVISSLFLIKSEIKFCEEDINPNELDLKTYFMLFQSHVGMIQDAKTRKSGKKEINDNALDLQINNSVTICAYQLMDKIFNSCFCKEDEIVIQSLETYFTIMFNMLEMKMKYNLTKNKLDINNEVLLFHIRHCKHYGNEPNKAPMLIPENFMTFTWYPVNDHLRKLPELSLMLFQETLGESFMKLNNMYEFILMVKKCYRLLPYHNFEHAFTVTHTMANILCRNRELFTKLEKEALMISAICHDMDHRGLNNNFIQMTKHPISKLYQSSLMENHHFFMTKKIMELCQICFNIKSQTFKKLMEEIYKNIISTDLSIYSLKRLQLVEILKNRTFSWDIENCRDLVKGALMTTCDLSLQAKPHILSCSPTLRVYEEFYIQGDFEKEMGLTPTPMMNRDNMNDLSEHQNQFLSVVVMPCFYVVATLLPNTTHLFHGCRNLRREWKILNGRYSLQDNDEINIDEEEN